MAQKKPVNPILEDDKSVWDKISNYLVYDSIPSRMVQGAWSGLTFPGDVMTGKADPMDIGRSLDTAGLLTLGAGAFPAASGELRAGIKFLPSSDSLNIPASPTVEQLGKYSRLEQVDLSKVRGSQSKMDWEKFNAGENGPVMFKGYEDAPVAALKRDGEYIVYDGHHRTAKAINEGNKSLPMYVIDASAYDPSNAGIAKSAARFSSDDEELLRELLGD